MDEPREVTAPGGNKRWIGADGRSYSSRDEAAGARSQEAEWWPELTEITPKEPKPSRKARVTEAIGLGIGVLFFGSMTIGNIYYLWTGKFHFKNEWAWLIMPIGMFLLAGLTLQSAAGLYGVLTGQKNINPDAVFDWWVNKLGCGILWLIGGLIALVVGWIALSNLFEGVSKGTVMIVVLLFGILVVLAQNADRR